ncbi:MAG: phytanoyl-CoA dioxygenase family protein [Anaerolineae bacterium]|nr:phytanoyl-CoA dioxygenase family protein [Anaerolineae bacterium]
MAVLTKEDREFWDENGYVIIHNAVPQENLDAVINLIYEFQGIDREDRDSWYSVPVGWGPEVIRSAGGMLEVYQHQALWDNRQNPRVYGAFADILGTEKLWVSMDRANFNPPERPGSEYKGFVHWDFDSRQRPIPLRVQGVLSLEDTHPGQGGFQCVPGFHNRLEEWAKDQPEDRDPFHPDLTGLEVQKIDTKAGDLLIWHVALPHGNSQNVSDRPRLAQYITMSPADENNEEARQERVRLWRERLQPQNHSAFPGDVRRWEAQFEPAELTELGQKLLGLKRWDD